MLCDAAKGKRGGALAGALHAHTRHGGARRELVNQIMKQVCVPLFAMTQYVKYSSTVEKTLTGDFLDDGCVRECWMILSENSL